MADMIEKVSDTAFGVAYFRALESARPDALFHDPLASVLAGEQGKKMAAAMPSPAMARQIVIIRTRIIDDYIQLAIAQGVDTIVNLGAGLDTRPYRMDLPESLLWVEADYPHVIEFKEQHLAAEKPRCRLESVKLDLADVSSRRQALAGISARANKMLVLTEGVLPYLSTEEVSSLAHDLKQLEKVRYWIVEYVSPETAKYRQHRRVRRKMKNAPFKFAPPDWFGFFAEHGWRPKEIRYLVEEAERLHRPIELPLRLKIPFMIGGLFAPKERGDAFRKFQGYVLLQPGADPGAGA
jgi:methyltransferase (TIGR00027 family)